METGKKSSQSGVLISTALLCFVAGALYAWSAMIPALRQAFQVQNQQAGMVFSLAILAFTLVCLAAPRLPASFRGLRGIAAASLIGAAALFLAAIAPNFQFFLLAYSLGFGGASGAIYITSLEIGSNSKNPKLVTAVMVASFGFGGVVFGPVLRLLVGAQWGLAALFVPAGFMVVAAIIAVYWLPKSDLVVSRKLEIATVTKAPKSREPDLSYKIIILLWFAMATGSAAGLMTLGLATTVIESQGGTLWLSSLALSGVAIGNTGGRLIIGVLPRQFPVGFLVPLASVGSLIGLLISLLASNPAITAIGIILVAGGYGTVASSIPVLTQILFGTNRFGRIYSIIFTAWGAAGLVSPWLAGLLFDIYGNFSAAFMLAAGASLFSLGFSLQIKRAIECRALVKTSGN